MCNIPSSARSLLAALTLSLALAGCVVGPVPGGVSVGFVAAAPPAPIYEPIGVAPYPGAIWVGGSWGWSGSRYVWNRGYWQRGRPGYRWVPNRWNHGPRGWSSTPGHWARR